METFKRGQSITLNMTDDQFDISKVDALAVNLRNADNIELKRFYFPEVDLYSKIEIENKTLTIKLSSEESKKLPLGILNCNLTIKFKQKETSNRYVEFKSLAEITE